MNDYFEAINKISNRALRVSVLARLISANIRIVTDAGVTQITQVKPAYNHSYVGPLNGSKIRNINDEMNIANSDLLQYTSEIHSFEDINPLRNGTLEVFDTLPPINHEAKTIDAMAKLACFIDKKAHLNGYKPNNFFTISKDYSTPHISSNYLSSYNVAQ
jgi:hypothetical protein